MIKKLIQKSALVILVGVFCSFGSSVFAQGDGGDIPGDGGGIPGDVGTDPNPPADTGGAAQGGGGGNGISEGQGRGEIEPISIEQSDDTRNQGFVGATAPQVQAGFVGVASGRTGSPLADGATFGGGVNNSVNSQFTGGSNNNFQGGQGAQNGVTITRRSIRARLRPSFSAPRPSGKQVATRFNDHFYRQPGSQNLTGQYSINIQNRTAFLDGAVNTRDDMDRLVRQLRLEPGVYKIVNRLQVTTQ